MWQNLGALQTSLAEAFKTLCNLLSWFKLSYHYLGQVATCLNVTEVVLGLFKIGITIGNKRRTRQKHICILLIPF